MLTYKRSEKMLKCLENLVGLPKLNKIIIVWNAVDLPDVNFPWPKQDVQMQVKTGKNMIPTRLAIFMNKVHRILRIPDCASTAE